MVTYQPFTAALLHSCAVRNYQPPPPPPPPPPPDEPPPPEKLDEELLTGCGMVDAMVEAIDEEKPPIRSPKPPL
jgi:hypothetical protein